MQEHIDQSFTELIHFEPSSGNGSNNISFNFYLYMKKVNFIPLCIFRSEYLTKW